MVVKQSIVDEASGERKPTYVVEPGNALLMCPCVRIFKLCQYSLNINITKYHLPPVGSLLGNRPWPQMPHAATPVMTAAKAKKGA
jgi:hypothetical protein